MATRRQPRPVRPRAGDAIKYEKAIQQAYVTPLMLRIQRRFARAAAVDQAYRALDGEVSAVTAQPRSGVPTSAIQEALGRVNKYDRERLRKTFRSALGVDVNPFLLDAPTELYMQERVSDNVDLIKTIPPRMHDSLKARIEQLTRDKAFDQALLMQALRAEYKSTGYNLRRITRDQTQKLTKQLSEIRYRQLGIEGYRWETAGDGDVRPTHVANSGRVFRWDSPPPETGNPGRDIQCRCVAIPLVTRADRERLQRDAPSQGAPAAPAAAPAPSATPTRPAKPARPVRPRRRPVRKPAAKPTPPPPAGPLPRPQRKPTRHDAPDKAATDIIADGLQKPPPAGFGNQRALAAAKRIYGDQSIPVVDGATFDRMPGPAVIRGVTERKHLQSNMDGTAGGSGIFGDGQYYGTYKGMRTEALGYISEDGHIFAAKLTEDAVVVTADELIDLAIDPRVGKSATARAMLDSNNANVAMSHKIDAYWGGPEGDFLVVVNRNKLVVDERTMPGGELYERAETRIMEKRKRRNALWAKMDSSELTDAEHKELVAVERELHNRKWGALITEMGEQYE